MRVCFVDILSREMKKRGGGCYGDRVYFNFCYGFQYGLNRSLVKNRAPHGLGFMRAGQVRNSYPGKRQKKRDDQYDETNHSAMFC